MGLAMPPLPSDDSFCFSCCKIVLLQWKDIIKLVMIPLHSCIFDIIELLLKIWASFLCSFPILFSIVLCFIHAQCVI